jgi:hypothetical protein
MKFETIYERTIPLWGDKLEFDDGKPHLKDGFLSYKLSASWDRAEEEVSNENNWDGLMVWTMFQVFHAAAKVNFEQGIYEFGPSDIDPSLIERRYFENLSDDHHSKELAEYQKI